MKTCEELDDLVRGDRVLGAGKMRTGGTCCTESRVSRGGWRELHYRGCRGHSL